MTSMSRTAPRSAPSQRSSPRNRAAKCWSRNGSNVRRSERNRRVATRAWWIASGSLPSMMPGSCSTRRAYDFAMASRTTSLTVSVLFATGSAFGGAYLGARDRELLESHLRLETLRVGDLAPGAVGLERPCELVVGEVDGENLVEPGAQARIGDAQHRFDATVEVAGHHVGRSDDVLGLVRARRPEPQNARMLEVAPDDRPNPDVVREAGHSGTQAADAAHDEVDLRAGL